MKRILYIFSIIFLPTVISIACHKDPSIIPSEIESTIETRAGMDEMTHYYWYKGERIALIQNKEFVNIIADDDFLKSSNLSLQKCDLQRDDVVGTGQNLSKVQLNSKSTLSEFIEVIDDLKRNPKIKHILPYFEREGTTPIGTSDIFYVKLNAETDVETLKKMAEEYNVKILNQVPYTPLWYVISILNSSFSNSIDASNCFYESGLFEDIDPAFMFEYAPNAIPNDPMFNQQWAYRNYNYPQVHINIIDAWDITKGAGINVAILDTGIDPNHYELKPNFHPLSFDATSGKPYSVFDSSKPHGTHVAGIVAAAGDNFHQIVGVAPQSKIMRISHVLNIRNNPNASSQLASGINWAWQNGADIINNSWGDQGGQLFSDLHSTILENAIYNAMTKGRNGLGCVVIFAAGNDPPAMSYPSYTYDEILTVGNIRSDGMKASTSAYGTKLDVVAPGDNIISTFVNDGVIYGSGTSMASPHVAGIAALVLSVDNKLTQKQVVNIIEKNNQKIILL